ncbi:MAG: ECF-type sigma factor [Phycisphaerales bacterium JB041]
MAEAEKQAVTRILAGLASGDRSAVGELLPLVYDELHSLASAFFRDQRPGHTLQPTALVHEAFIKLCDRDDIEAGNRPQFLALASKVMRHLLVDHARARLAAKRGGAWERVTLSGLASNASATEIDVLALEDALEKLAALNEKDARLVELRFFGGLTSEEAAESLGISRTQAARRWRIVRAWLADEVGGAGEP